jgi:Cu2+-exporting ATPase/Cu+-exporting ATPase
VEVSKQEKLAELAFLRKKVGRALPLAAVSVALMVWEGAAALSIVPAVPEVWMDFSHHLFPLFALYALTVIGATYLAGALRFFRTGRANMDSLIGIGTVAAFLYSFAVSAFEEPLRAFMNVEQSYYDVTIVVIAFVTLGKYLEASAKLKMGDAIEKLIGLQVKTALVRRDGVDREVPIGEVVHGDLVIVKPGGKIPVDGEITEGEPFIDESMVTGESMPVEKQVGDSIATGTLNTTRAFTFRATKVGAETLLAHIIRMVEEAQSSKAPIQALADKISGVFVPVVLALGALALAGWLVVGSGTLGFAQALSYGIASFVGVLVIACPCALGLATPTALIVGVGKGAREGILIKDAATLETLHGVTALVVDKTGTITKGRPEVALIVPEKNISGDELLSLLASLESQSEHSLAHAVVSRAQEKKLAVRKVEKFEALKGKGVQGIIDGTRYFAGNMRFMEELEVMFDREAVMRGAEEGKTPVLIAMESEQLPRYRYLGMVMVSDALKPEAKEAVLALKKMGVRIIMLTGDTHATAMAIAREAGIEEVRAEVLPVEKRDQIKSLQEEGLVVAMAGDGVNDAPALAQADIGIAMATGTEVAIESAGIVLLHGDLAKLVKAVRLSKLTMRGVKQNLFWAFIYNTVGIPLAAGIFFPLFGWFLSPVFAGMAMAFSSVSVVANSLRLKAIRL